MINKVILLGRLGKDPVVRHLDNGRVVANITLATNDYYTKDGQKMENTEWHNLELWDNHARLAENYLRKGNIIYVEGKIRTDKYTDPDGVEKQIKKIRVLQMQTMGGLNRHEEDDNQTKPMVNEPENNYRGSENRHPTTSEGPEYSDDLPFPDSNQ
ncbi:MAG: single-stranded DNA-binding protein [Sphingomonadales bacterium]|jgi:single-strand DNA-binding protein